MKLRHKEVKFTLKEINDAGVFTGYASTFGNEDLGGDIIEQGAFAKTIVENPNVPILWGHDSSETIGVNLSCTEDLKGLAIVGELALGVRRADEARILMGKKAVRGLSIGYDPIVVDWSREKEGIRILKEVKLWEYSVTPFPMNPEARVTGVKARREDLENSLHSCIVYAKQNFGSLSTEQKTLLDKAIEELSALRAAQALGAATQKTDAPAECHATVLSDGLDNFLKFFNSENQRG